MSRYVLILLLTTSCLAATKAPAADPLGRDNPRSAVTAFLVACHQRNYAKASQYLDLSQLSPAARTQEGPNLAKDLESLLNADSHFDPGVISASPEPPADGEETIAEVKREDRTFPLQLHRIQPSGQPAVWLFAPETVTLLSKLAPVPTTESQIAARLPRFLVATQLFGTALWKWIALLIGGAALVALMRLTAALIFRFIRSGTAHGIGAWVEPLLLFLSVAAFRLYEEVVNPSALTRVGIADFLGLVVVAAASWGILNLIDIFLTRVDAVLDPRQRQVSHSLIYLGRRTSRAIVFAVAAIFVLNNWGFHMTTIIAGLGVGGIAVALAAQQTIANVFGGVSVIGDHPVMIGDFGSFGGVIGWVNDIGLRSTRIRTLSRTVVSIPNSSFAGMNLENYSLRDKILFNPTLQVKRATPKAQMEQAIEAIDKTLHADHRVESVPTTVRITGITSAAYSVEIFCYVRTEDADEYHKIASDLYLKINDELTAASVELV